jgi:hypothetical protein
MMMANGEMRDGPRCSLIPYKNAVLETIIFIIGPLPDESSLRRTTLAGKKLSIGV